jgi:hypothetical protein
MGCRTNGLDLINRRGTPDLILALASNMNGSQRPGRRTVAARGGAMAGGGG